MSAPALFDLAGKTALVTGSSEGLGLGIARGLAGAGASIVLNGRDQAKLTAAAKSLADSGLSVQPSAFDVADDVAVCGAFERLDAEGVSIDILVNNAGNQIRKPMLDLSTRTPSQCSTFRPTSGGACTTPISLAPFWWAGRRRAE
jgi:gluconate 5-dehydrogenase